MEVPIGLRIRPELGNDCVKITRLNEIAFGRPDESRLIELLRQNPMYIKGFSLVAVLEDKPVGHILLYPVLIRGEARIFRSLALVSLAVLPEYQGKGIGSALVNSGLDEARAGKYTSAVVRGCGDFFPRFGFIPASIFGISPPFIVADEAFLAMELFPGGLRGVVGTVDYPAEFSEFRFLS